MPKNLWGNINVEPSIQTPVALLSQQAALLTNATMGVLEGRVASGPGKVKDTFYHSLKIVAPALDRYEYTVLGVSHRIVLYPVYVTQSGASGTIKCDDEEQFEAEVARILQSDSTKRVLNALLAQSKAMPRRSAVSLFRVGGAAIFQPVKKPSAQQKPSAQHSTPEKAKPAANAHAQAGAQTGQADKSSTSSATPSTGAKAERAAKEKGAAAKKK